MYITECLEGLRKGRTVGRSKLGIHEISTFQTYLIMVKPADIELIIEVTKIKDGNTIVSEWKPNQADILAKDWGYGPDL